VRFRLLLIIMGVLVIVVYGTLAVLIMGMSGTEPGATTSPSEETAPRTVETARDTYPAAMTEAQSWQPEAQLVSATASWANVEAEEDLEEAPAWGFSFLSPETRQVRVVSVTQDGAEQAQTVDATAKTRTIDVTAWQVDSTEMLSLFLDNGGRDFLAQHPGATITLRVGLEEDGERLVWYAMGIHSGDRATIVVGVDATTGELLSTTP
jgi:hypothetical protein